MANTDLFAGGGSWWANRDNDLGAGTYGSSASQAIVLSGAGRIARRFEALHYHSGEDAEMLGAGASGGTSVTNQKGNFRS